jgi:hypothetical protein
MEVEGWVEMAGAGTTDTTNVWAVPFPQALEGVTCTLPEAVPVVTVTELVVPPAVCTQSEGKLQL